MLRLLFDRGRVVECGPGEPAIEFILRRLKKRWRRPEQRLSLRRCIDGRAIVPGQHARLQLPNPVPALRQSEIPLTCQMVLEAEFVELLTVERSERRCQATKRPDQLELRGDDLDDEAEPRLLRKLEAPFGLTLRVCQRISSSEKIRVQVVAAVRGKREVAGLVRDIERAAHQLTAGANVPRPWHDEIAERHVGSGLIAMQPALFRKLIPELAELEPTRVVLEMRSGDHAKEHIREARCVAVA